MQVYRPPTSAPVIDPFRPPPQPWLPGNRGIEYGTLPGAPITAIGPGRVAFAGPVAGRLVATIDHPDGLRSSYVGLAEILVARGDAVAGGTVIGRAAGPFHLGVRRQDTYLDPALLWGRRVGAGRVYLVPVLGSAREGAHLGRVAWSSLHLPTGPSPDGPAPESIARPLPTVAPGEPEALGARSPKPLERRGP